MEIYYKSGIHQDDNTIFRALAAFKNAVYPMAVNFKTLRTVFEKCKEYIVEKNLLYWQDICLGDYAKLILNSSTSNQKLKVQSIQWYIITDSIFDI